MALTDYIAALARSLASPLEGGGRLMIEFAAPRAQRPSALAHPSTVPCPLVLSLTSPDIASVLLPHGGL